MLINIIYIIPLLLCGTYGKYNCWDNNSVNIISASQVVGSITDHEQIDTANPDVYKKGSRCRWKIIDETRSGVITLKFKRFDLAQADDGTITGFKYDFVSFKDGQDNDIVWYTGKEIPPVVQSPGSEILIDFVTQTDKGTGFELEYSISTCPNNNCNHGNLGFCFLSQCSCNPGYAGLGCQDHRCDNNCGDFRGTCLNNRACQCSSGWYGGDCLQAYCDDKLSVFVEPMGKLTDHHEDLSKKTQYLHNNVCKWLISPRDAKRVQLSFDKFETELDYDFVTVYDGPSEAAPILFKGSGLLVTPFNLVSSGPMMYITFTTDVGLAFGGFDAHYNSLDTTIDECPLSSCPILSGGHSTGMLVLAAILGLLIGLAAGVLAYMSYSKFATQSNNGYSNLAIPDNY